MLTDWSKFGSGNTYDVVEVDSVEEHGGTGVDPLCCWWWTGYQQELPDLHNKAISLLFSSQRQNASIIFLHWINKLENPSCRTHPIYSN
jgi:hypothetical protein